MPTLNPDDAVPRSPQSSEDHDPFSIRQFLHVSANGTLHLKVICGSPRGRGRFRPPFPQEPPGPRELGVINARYHRSWFHMGTC